MRKRKRVIRMQWPFITIETNPNPLWVPLMWRLGSFLLEHAARRNDLSRSFVAEKMHDVNFNIDKAIQARFEARND